MIKYKYLYAWDKMMGSYEYWITMNQKRAEEDNAPEDAVYKDSKDRWHRFSEVTNPLAIDEINKILKSMKGVNYFL